MKIRFPAGHARQSRRDTESYYPGKLPSTRMGSANLVRHALSQAQTYARRNRSAKEPAAPNLKYEALELALQKKVPVIFAGHRADDLMTGLRSPRNSTLDCDADPGDRRLSDSRGDAWTPRSRSSSIRRCSGRPSPETFHGHLGNAAFLTDRKIPVAICTAFEGYVPKTRVLRYEAAMAMVNGLGHDRALRGITLDAAKILGIDDQYRQHRSRQGRRPGPIRRRSVRARTHVTHTIMAGRVVHDRAEYLKLPFERRRLAAQRAAGDYGCCLGTW